MKFKLLFCESEHVLRIRLNNMKLTSLHSKESSISQVGYGSFVLHNQGMGREKEWRGQVVLHNKEELGKREKTRGGKGKPYSREVTSE